MEWMVKDATSDPVFYLAGGVAVLAGVGVVTRRNPVYCAIFMLVAFLSLAVVYLLLSASFLAAMHVLVYTGAILVLFLFVIMLLNLKPDELGQEYPLPALTGCFIAGALALAGMPFTAGFFSKDAILAATAMTMRTRTWPALSPWWRAKARSATLTPLSISSTDIRMMRRLRRARTP